MKKVPLYMKKNLPIEKRVEDLLKRMTLDEKVAQLWAVFKGQLLINDRGDNGEFSEEKAKLVMGNGLGRISAIFHSFDIKNAPKMANRIQKYAIEKTRLGIPVLIDCEALHGCMAPGSTSFPQAIALGATWNPAFLEEIAAAIGKEVRARGSHQVLSPVCDIARDPRCGRTEETYGEDPLLVSRMAVAFVKGIQSQRIITTPKHFAANFVGDGGRDSFPIHFSERLMREIYLPPYEAVFKEAGALSVMSAYHSFDGLPCTANRWLLTDLLRKEWGFQGIVVSDWGATVQIHEYHRVGKNRADAALRAIKAGLDVELPEADCFTNLKALVQSGKLPVKVLDEAVRRNLRVKFWTGMFDRPFVNPQEAVRITNCAAHRKMALEAARQSITLLKNDGVLPLKKTVKTVAVIGPNAAEGRLGGYSTRNIKVVSPLEGVKRIVSRGTKVLYAEGCGIKGKDRSGFKKAVAIARKADVVLMFMGNTAAVLLYGDDGNQQSEGEQQDRCNLDLPGVQEDLILEVARANPNVNVVLIGGSAVTMTRWINKAHSIVEGWYPGQEGGTALAEILFGDINPSGKTPITFPKVTGQSPLYYNTKPSGRTYDYNDLRGEQTQFPFGHGLSYTTFDYSRLKVRSSGKGRNMRLDVSAVIRNTGKRAGDEVVQLYIHDEFSDRSRPLKELKGFKRISLKAGQRTTVRFKLEWKDLAYLGHDLKPTLEAGGMEVMIGSSSADIRLRYSTMPADSVDALEYVATSLMPPAADIAAAELPAVAVKFPNKVRVNIHALMPYTDFREVHGGKHGVIYLNTHVDLAKGGRGLLLYGADGPSRVWVNGKPVSCAPNASNPIRSEQYKALVRWKKGRNEVIYAVGTNHGNAWGVTTRAKMGK